MKLMLMVLMMMGAATTVKAQEVFNILKQSAENIVNNPKATEFELKVNQYKLTALQYIPSQAIKQFGKTTTATMDIQAYYLNVFLTHYFKEIQGTKNEKDRKEVIDKYIKATQNNPMYEDKNRAATESFVNDPGGYTPFSINVNWEKAAAELKIDD